MQAIFLPKSAYGNAFRHAGSGYSLEEEEIEKAQLVRVRYHPHLKFAWSCRLSFALLSFPQSGSQLILHSDMRSMHVINPFSP